MTQNKTNITLAFLLISLMAFSCAGNSKNSEGSKGPQIEYRVVESDDYSQELWAIKDGQFQNTGIGDVVWIIDQRDYDGDGLEEAFIGESAGGSASWSSIVFFDKESNTFRKVEFRNLDVSLNDSVEKWNGKWSFTGGNDAHYVRFIYEKGRILKVEDYTKPKPDGTKELLVIDPNTAFTPEEQEAPFHGREVKKQVSYDLNGDGKNEIIEYSYQSGVRWGDPEVDYKPMLNICIKWSNGGTMKLDSDDDHWLEFKILSTKTNGVYDLASGIRGGTYRWNGSRYLK